MHFVVNEQSWFGSRLKRSRRILREWNGLKVNKRTMWNDLGFAFYMVSSLVCTGFRVTCPTRSWNDVGLERVAGSATFPPRSTTRSPDTRMRRIDFTRCWTRSWARTSTLPAAITRSQIWPSSPGAPITTGLVSPSMACPPCSAGLNS